MYSDKLVTGEDVLQAIMKLRRHGYQRVVEDLERREPDLIEHLLEESTLIHHKLIALGALPKPTRQLHRRIESLMLVLVTALQSAHTRLWADGRAGSGTAV